MNLTDEEREALVIARKARAFDTWEETKGIVECGYWHAAANSNVLCLLLYDHGTVN